MAIACEFTSTAEDLVDLRLDALSILRANPDQASMADPCAQHSTAASGETQGIRPCADEHNLVSVTHALLLLLLHWEHI